MRVLLVVIGVLTAAILAMAVGSKIADLRFRRKP